MSTLAACACVCLHVCVYLCVCVSLLRLTAEYCKQIHQLSVYTMYMCVVACVPATFRTNIQKDEQNESICLALFCYPAATFVCCDACDIRCSFPGKLHQCVVVAPVVAIFA